jgi:hypothetical protein
VRPIHRISTAILAFALVGAAVLGSGGPAQADPKFPLFWGNVTGETVLAKPAVRMPIPKSSFAAVIDIADGSINGDIKTPDLTLKMKLFGFLPVTSIVRLVPVGKTAGKADLGAGKIQATTTFTIEVVRTSSDLTPKINLVPAGCTTNAPSAATIHNTGPIDLGGTIPMEGVFTVPAFKNCGILTPLLTYLISGPGNTLKINLAN